MNIIIRDKIIFRTTIRKTLRICFLAIGIFIFSLIMFRFWMPAFIFTGLILFMLMFTLLKRKPEIIVIISIIISYLPHGMNVSYPLLLVTIVILFLERLLCRKKILTNDAVVISWLCIILLGVLTLLKWHRLFSGVQWFAALAIFPLLLYVLVNDEYITQDGIRWITSNGIPFLFGVIVAETYIDLFSKLLKQNSVFSISNLYAFRSLSISSNGSNRLAGMLAFFAIYILLNKQTWKGSWIKNSLIAVVVYMSLLIPFMMISKGAMVFLLTAGAIYMIGKIISERKIKILPVIIATMSILLVLKPFIDQMVFRMHNIKYDGSTFARLIMWRDSIIKIKNGIIVGAGPGQVVYHDLSQSLEDPHNMFLRYGVEFGGVSIIFLLIILIYPLTLFFKRYRIDRKSSMSIFLMFAPPLIGTLMHSQIDSTFTSRNSGIVLWLIWAIFVKTLSGYTKTNE